mgnify:CR=1 FL=1
MTDSKWTKQSKAKGKWRVKVKEEKKEKKSISSWRYTFLWIIHFGELQWQIQFVSLTYTFIHRHIDTPTKMILLKWIESIQRNAVSTNQMFGTKTTIFRGLKSCNAIPMKLMLIYLRRMNIQWNDHTENRINIIQWIQRIHEKTSMWNHILHHHKPIG